MELQESSSMIKVINLRRFRKQKTRGEAQNQAAAKRIAHGRCKADRELLAAKAKFADRRFEAQRLQSEAAAEPIPGQRNDG